MKCDRESLSLWVLLEARLKRLKSVAECHFWRLALSATKIESSREMFLCLLTFENDSENYSRKLWSGRRGSNPQLSAWESKFPLLYFHNLQNRLGKINVHALHTVHAVPDLRVAGGRLGDGVSIWSAAVLNIRTRRDKDQFTRAARVYGVL